MMFTLRESSTKSLRYVQTIIINFNSLYNYTSDQYFYMQYRKETLGLLNQFKTKFGNHLSKEKTRLSDVCDRVSMIIKSFNAD